MLVIIYMILGYWAAGKTYYANKIIIEYKMGGFFMQRLIMGTLLGWIFIPWAIAKIIFNR